MNARETVFVIDDDAAVRSAMRAMLEEQSSGDSSSRYDRGYPPLREWVADDRFEIGEMVAWISINEDDGRRGKR